MNIRKFAYSLAIASALIAGVIVVIVDWKRLLRRLEGGI
jgi:hypothetical protein